MIPFFSQDQIENLRSWKNSLETKVALGWKSEEDEAEVQIHALLEAKNLHEDGTFTSDEFDHMFH